MISFLKIVDSLHYSSSESGDILVYMWSRETDAVIRYKTSESEREIAAHLHIVQTFHTCWFLLPERKDHVLFRGRQEKTYFIWCREAGKGAPPWVATCEDQRDS